MVVWGGYMFRRIIKTIGSCKHGQVCLGLWEKQGKEYEGYFITTGLLPDFDNQIVDDPNDLGVDIIYND